jgi:hypothetical protein
MPTSSSDSSGPATPEELAAHEARIDAWLRTQLAENPVVEAVERGEPDEHRWYVRLRGEEKGPFTIWFTLRQRSLHHETYMMPAPMENHARLYEHLLRRNLRLHGAFFAVGPEDAVFLVGKVPLRLVDDGTLDEVLGSVYAAIELCFRPAMRIGYASLFKG